MATYKLTASDITENLFFDKDDSSFEVQVNWDKGQFIGDFDDKPDIDSENIDTYYPLDNGWNEIELTNSSGDEYDGFEISLEEYNRIISLYEEEGIEGLENDGWSMFRELVVHGPLVLESRE
jgi:hypothetical protein